MYIHVYICEKKYIYTYICIYMLTPPGAYIFLSLQGGNTAFLQETDFLGEEEKRQTLSAFGT